MRAGLFLALALLTPGCRNLVAAPNGPVRVQSLEVAFETEGRGQIELGLEVTGGEGEVATQAQWQLVLDGRPLGSGIQLLSQQLAPGSTLVALSAPLPLPHTTRDEGWRTVTLEVSGELIVSGLVDQRHPFSYRRQALLRGAPLPANTPGSN